MALLSVKNLTFAYPDGEPLFAPLTFTVEKGALCLLLGETGCGKTTLLRLLKPTLMTAGTKNGEILFDGRDLSALSPEEGAIRIGYVSQMPEQQIVTDRVESELAFAGENLGWSAGRIRRRCAEIAAFFGIEGLWERETASLSGGEKQLLNLASVLLTDPDLLLLDEPTSMLDPIAAQRFIDTVCRLNRETGLTVLMTEHRPERMIAQATDILCIGKEGVTVRGAPKKAVPQILSACPALAPSMPAAARLGRLLCPDRSEFPLSVAEGRALLTENAGRLRLAERNEGKSGETVLSVRDVSFRYARKERDILSGISLDVKKGEIFCLVGGNGSGKSTLLSVMAGIRSPYYGTVKVRGKKIKDYLPGELYRECLALMPQDVSTLFLRGSVREECEGFDLTSLPFSLAGLEERHPYDLSGGERQLLALALLLGKKPQILLLDEPTKGLDAFWREKVCGILRTLAEDGKTVVLVTHDPEFAAQIGDRCAMLFRGQIVSCAPMREFFAENAYYTTETARMTKGILPEAVRTEDILTEEGNGG